MSGQSGYHSNDAMDYLNQAYKNVKGGLRPHRRAIYYFFLKCKENKRVDREFHISMPGEEIKGTSTGNTVAGDVISDLTSSPNHAAAKSHLKKEAQFDHAMKGFDCLAAAMLKEKEDKANVRQTKLQMNLLNMEQAFLPNTYAEIRSQVLTNIGIKIGSKEPASVASVAAAGAAATAVVAKQPTTTLLINTQKRLKELQKKIEGQNGSMSTDDRSSTDDDKM
jgi:hypothetical protein